MMSALSGRTRGRSVSPAIAALPARERRRPRILCHGAVPKTELVSTIIDGRRGPFKSAEFGSAGGTHTLSSAGGPNNGQMSCPRVGLAAGSAARQGHHRGRIARAAARRRAETRNRSRRDRSRSILSPKLRCFRSDTCAASCRGSARCRRLARAPTRARAAPACSLCRARSRSTVSTSARFFAKFSPWKRGLNAPVVVGGEIVRRADRAGQEAAAERAVRRRSRCRARGRRRARRPRDRASRANTRSAAPRSDAPSHARASVSALASESPR